MKAFIKWINKDKDASPLAVFRIFFGALVLFSLIRFQYNDWIYKLYIEPDYFFSYYGFSWIKPLGEWTYALFGLCGLAALGVMLGFRYRLSATLLFLSFTYIELMDKTNYLNHYYFISVLSFLLIFLPMNRYYSIDAYRDKNLRSQWVAAWSIYSLRLMMSIVYFYAGLAKLNSDWLFKAMPLKIWLPSKYETPLIGGLLQENWVHYAFSWGGAAYDLLIPFLLLWKPTRRPAFIMVLVFHILTRILFPIGMFPYIMIVSALIFFDKEIHHKILDTIGKCIGHSRMIYQNGVSDHYRLIPRSTIAWVLTVFFLIQLLFPFRFLLYPEPSNLFWTENGYRYSWRVMLMEKAGYAEFTVVDPLSGSKKKIKNSDYLTPIQEKQMSTQADFILEYAHFLEEEYKEKGIKNPSVYVESFVALNGERSRRYVRSELDLTKFQDSWWGSDILEEY